MSKQSESPKERINVTYKPATGDFIDGTTYNAKDPISYINSFKIGNKDKAVQ